MKKGYFKVLSIILAVFLLTVIFTGCKSGQQNTPTTAATTQQETKAETPATSEAQPEEKKLISEKPITLTYWVPVGSNTAAVLQNYGEMEMFKEMEKISNVKIEFLHPPTGQHTESFNLMIASRDLPDMIEYGWTTGYPGGAEKAVNDGIILALNDLIASNAPFLKGLLDGDANLNRQAKSDSGIIYAFPAIGIGDSKTQAGPLMRKDWLDDLGLTVPETIEEWTAVLAAFKEEKGATAPLTGTFGDFNGGGAAAANGVDCISGAFGVGTKFYLDNGKVKYGPLQPEYKQYVELLRDWYAKGLLDQDIIANNGTAIDARFKAGEAGLRYGFIGGGIGNYMNMMKDIDPKFNLVAIPYPVTKKGDVSPFNHRAWEVRTSGMVAITSANKYPEESTRWTDYFYGEEGNLLKNFGIEGLTYNMVNGYPTYTDLVMKNPEGLSVGWAMGKYMRSSEPSPGYIDSRYHEQYWDLPQQKAAMKLWGPLQDNALKVLLPQLTPKQEESEEFATITASLVSYFQESFSKFIMGIEPMEKYDTFVSQLKQMKAERAVEILQGALERYNNR